MASSGTLANGVTSYSSTIATGSTAETVTFSDRYGYVTVVNGGTTAIYVRADGAAATVAGNSCYVVLPNEGLMLANGLPLWFPSSNVVLAGTVQYPTGGGGTTATKNGQPGEVQPYMSSLAGKVANPGTIISLICSASGGAYTVSAAG